MVGVTHMSALCVWILKSTNWIIVSCSHFQAESHDFRTDVMCFHQIIDGGKINEFFLIRIVWARSDRRLDPGESFANFRELGCAILDALLRSWKHWFHTKSKKSLDFEGVKLEETIRLWAYQVNFWFLDLEFSSFRGLIKRNTREDNEGHEGVIVMKSWRHRGSSLHFRRERTECVLPQLANPLLGSFHDYDGLGTVQEQSGAFFPKKMVN